MSHVWYLDTGASNYMTDDKDNFFELNLLEGGMVRFWDNWTAEIAVRSTVLFGLDNDTSSIYLFFQTLLILFYPIIYMIQMKLIWIDVVFSSIVIVLFYCKNKSSQNQPEIFDIFLWNIWGI